MSRLVRLSLVLLFCLSALPAVATVPAMAQEEAAAGAKSLTGAQQKSAEQLRRRLEKIGKQQGRKAMKRAYEELSQVEQAQMRFATTIRRWRHDSSRSGGGGRSAVTAEATDAGCRTQTETFTGENFVGADLTKYAQTFHWCANGGTIGGPPDPPSCKPSWDTPSLWWDFIGHTTDCSLGPPLAGGIGAGYIEYVSQGQFQAGCVDVKVISTCVGSASPWVWQRGQGNGEYTWDVGTGIFRR